MASKDKTVREAQRARWADKLKERTAMLAGRGIDEKAIAKDATIKEIKSHMREGARQIKAIMAVEKRGEELAAHKTAKAEAEKALKEKKPAAEEPAESKAPQKKKAKTEKKKAPKEGDEQPKQA